jgi:hypothetical protein
MNSKFSEGCKEVFDLPHAQVQPTAVRDVNILHIEELIFGNTQITVRNIASISGISVGSVETAIHETYCSKNVCWAGPEDINVGPEGAARCCVCRTSAPV